MSGILGGQSTVATPAPKPVAPMPDEKSPGAAEAARRANQAIMSRAGRSSTILTAPESRKSGYDNYAARSLGTNA